MNIIDSWLKYTLIMILDPQPPRIYAEPMLTMTQFYVSTQIVYVVQRFSKVDYIWTIDLITSPPQNLPQYVLNSERGLGEKMLES